MATASAVTAAYSKVISEIVRATAAVVGHGAIGGARRRPSGVPEGWV